MESRFLEWSRVQYKNKSDLPSAIPHRIYSVDHTLVMITKEIRGIKNFAKLSISEKAKKLAQVIDSNISELQNILNATEPYKLLI
ncbi:MAG: hypothetical protein ABSF91_08305 [Bacteroidota bacterium]